MSYFFLSIFNNGILPAGASFMSKRASNSGWEKGKLTALSIVNHTECPESAAHFPTFKETPFSIS
jgi:hypothetical protein